MFLVELTEETHPVMPLVREMQRQGPSSYLCSEPFCPHGHQWCVQGAHMIGAGLFFESSVRVQVNPPPALAPWDLKFTVSDHAEEKQRQTQHPLKSCHPNYKVFSSNYCIYFSSQSSRRYFPAYSIVRWGQTLVKNEWNEDTVRSATLGRGPQKPSTWDRPVSLPHRATKPKSRRGAERQAQAGSPGQEQPC